jgi:hypothetical protein
MAVRGKSINLFLMDGTPTGRIKVTLANWTGVAYRIPRTELDKCKGRDDLAQSGVYFLFGTVEGTGEDVVYIGQAGIRKNGNETSSDTNQVFSISRSGTDAIGMLPSEGFVVLAGSVGLRARRFHER